MVTFLAAIHVTCQSNAMAAFLVAKLDPSIKCNGGISGGKLRDLSNKLVGKMVVSSVSKKQQRG